MLEQEDPEKAWEEVFDVLHAVLDESCPIKEIKVKRVKEEWMRADLLEQIKLKDDLMAKSREWFIG